MTARLIDGKALAAEVLAEVAHDVASLRARGVMPGFAVVLASDDEAHRSYARAKAAVCEQVGMVSELVLLPEAASKAGFLAAIATLNADERIHGILVQFPMPPQIDEDAAIEAVDPAKDVDGLHPLNLGRLLRGEPGAMIPATPASVIEMLLRTGNDPAGKRAVVVGDLPYLARPVAMLLSAKAPGGNATVTMVDAEAPGLAELTRRADILVAAAGSPALITAAMVRPGAVVIDMAANRVADPTRARGWRLAGDVDPDVREVAGWLCPIPGGVGPMTIALLLRATVALTPRPPLPTLRERG